MPMSYKVQRLVHSFRPVWFQEEFKDDVRRVILAIRRVSQKVAWLTLGEPLQLRKLVSILRKKERKVFQLTAFQQ
jgi:hypothetical protein